MTTVQRAHRRPPELDLRDRCLAALSRSGLTARKIVALDGRHIAISPHGNLTVSVREGASVVLRYLDDDASEPLLEHLERHRLWSRHAPLFVSHTAPGVRGTERLSEFAARKAIERWRAAQPGAA
ncbi:MAG: hypothetical protein AAGN46_05515 [Acidobacteriota bacterium]